MNKFKVTFPRKEKQWFIDRVSIAIATMNDVVFSLEFKINFDIEYNKSNMLDGELSQIKHSMPDEIIKRILNCENHLVVRSYYAPFGAIGKTYSGDPTIWINTAKMGTSKYIGSNLLHESSHIYLEASHDWSPTKRRPNSLSYLLNRVYEKSYDEIYGEPVIVKRKPWWKRIFG